MGYILFPFSSALMKRSYHQSFNERMVREVQNSFQKANALI